MLEQEVEKGRKRTHTFDVSVNYAVLVQEAKPIDNVEELRNGMKWVTEKQRSAYNLQWVIRWILLQEFQDGAVGCPRKHETERVRF